MPLLSRALRVFPRWIGRLMLALLALLALFALLLAFFPWDKLRVPLNHYVSEQLGRRFEVTERLSVRLGWVLRVRLDGVELANPQWAAEPLLLKAKAVEFDLQWWPPLPLLRGQVVLPRLWLDDAQIALQIEPDGRRTWALARDTTRPGAAPHIGELTVTKGSLGFRAAAQGADIKVLFALAADHGAAALAGNQPLSYKASGKWQQQAFTAQGRASSVLQLSGFGRPEGGGGFSLSTDAKAGAVTLKASLSGQDVASQEGLVGTFELRGRSLDELYLLTGVVLPATPAYQIRGVLTKRGPVWRASELAGSLGSSDLRGALSYDTSGALGLLTGDVGSVRLDMDDLGAVVGSAPKPVRAAAAKASRPQFAPKTIARAANKSRASGTFDAKNAALEPAGALATQNGKVLPTARLDGARLKTMNADVRYSAQQIQHIPQLALDSAKVRVQLNAGVLTLDPLEVGIAGGTLAGKLSIDANVSPPAVSTRMALRGVQLGQLFPTLERTQSSLGKIAGQINLQGRGDSVAQMLGSANGEVTARMDKGEISNILLEFIGLDGGEVIKFFLSGDRNVAIYCAAAAFAVDGGVMHSKTLLFDTLDTVITGTGTVDLRNETLDIGLKPVPKDVSVLSFRSPLKIGGSFASPTAGPDKAALSARVGLTLLLGAINPLLGLAATVETGPGEDADCKTALEQTQGRAQAKPMAAKPARAAPKK